MKFKVPFDETDRYKILNESKTSCHRVIRAKMTKGSTIIATINDKEFALLEVTGIKQSPNCSDIAIISFSFIEEV